jgi:hypothetical protein
LSKTKYTNPVYNGITCFGEDLSSQTEVRQLELKWLIKAYNNTTDKSKFFNPFSQTTGTRSNNKIETEYPNLKSERAGERLRTILRK